MPVPLLTSYGEEPNTDKEVCSGGSEYSSPETHVVHLVILDGVFARLDLLGVSLAEAGHEGLVCWRIEI